jgi:hypothetical protein
MGRMEPPRVATGTRRGSDEPVIWHGRSRLSNAFADSYQIAIVTREMRHVRMTPRAAEGTSSGILLR